MPRCFPVHPLTHIPLSTFAASLSAVTEPIVNRILVNRMTVGEAIATLDPALVAKFFNTTIATNFIKFPFFEVTNVIMQGVDLPAQARGAITGAVFCTLTLPITNYRCVPFCLIFGAVLNNINLRLSVH